MIRSRSVPVLLAALLAAGCQQSPKGDQAARNPADILKESSAAADQVRLRSDGIEVTGAEGTYLAFDSPRDTVESELARVLGPIVDRSRNAECGAGTVDSTSFPGGLTVNFQAGRMEGWYLSDTQSVASDIATAEGITIGKDERALDTAYEVEQIESTLGDEFTTEVGISGILAGAEGSRIVEALYSGTTCFFR
ncbi:MAG: aspartate-semialdehyde dehydrogenase [Erythrobacter sp.]|nr:aspartate-semialdehyde dehydrogenase [Erythrobacter sp.]